MKLGRAIKRFATVPVAGYRKANDTFIPQVAWGDFHTFDRFISDRSFGMKKRLYATHSDAEIPEQYEVIRVPGGVTYLVSAKNLDIEGLNPYLTAYLLQQAVFRIEVIDFTTTTLASGAEGDAVPVVVDTVWGDFERYTSEGSRESDVARFSVHEFNLPASTEVHSNNELRVNGIYYEVKEVTQSLLTKDVRALQRSTT